MTNEALFNNLITRYNKVAYTHNYIFGYTDRGNVYVSFATKEVLPYVCSLQKGYVDYRGGYASLRFTPSKSQKELLKMNKSFILCSKAYFESLVKESKYNRGEIFEKLITEHFGQEWTKDNIPFTEAGDIKIGDIAYQIKYQRATFCTEHSIANLESKARG